jgi:tetratricopeptide (TPR) repeat protein
MNRIWKGKLFQALSALIATAAMAVAAPAFAQSGATVHGHVTNPAGQPINSGEVKFSKDSSVDQQKFAYTGSLDANGAYSISGIAPGDYYVFFMQGTKHLDRLQISIKSTDTDKVLDDDMSRQEYIDKMTPEEKKTLEEYKKKNAETVEANKTINNLNATLKKVRAGLSAAAGTKADVSQDVTDMKAATSAKPDEGLLWLNLGDAEQAQGDHLAAADKAAGKIAATDDDVKQMYSSAADSYKKGIDLENASKKPNLSDEAIGYNQMGNTLAKATKSDDASAAFENAAKLDPTHAGMYYNNEAAIMFNAQQNEPALAAAEKAIAADPTRPDPYYIKGQVLIAKSQFDNKTQKLIPPPGCVDAYQKYLQLAPDGKYATSVKEVLTSLGEKIDTRYKAGKK